MNNNNNNQNNQQPSSLLSMYDRTSNEQNNQPNSNYQTESNNYNNFNQNQILSNEFNSSEYSEELLKEFIGNNYDKIKNSKFNVPAFFFSNAYMLYRNLLLYGLIEWVVEMIILNLLKSNIIFIILHIALGFLANRLYLKYSIQKVKEIKANNPTKNEEELKEICRQTGGTSTKKLLLGIGLEIITIIIIFISMFVSVLSNLFGFFFQDNTNQNSNTKTKYSGLMSYDTSIDITKEFDISIPKVFTTDKKIKYEYEYEYKTETGTFNSCKFTFFSVEGYNSAEELLKQMQEYYRSAEGTSEVAVTKTDNLNWQFFSTKNDFETTTYYYGITKNKKAYLLQYEIQKDAPSNCKNYKETIVNSIKSK